jgi:hypothetical protein
VEIYSTTLGCKTQTISHPRPVTAICWRHSQASSRFVIKYKSMRADYGWSFSSYRDDLILYTITSDSTLRIFLPVLDSPQHLQLHASLDPFSIPFCTPPNVLAPQSSVFWLDREVISTSFEAILASHPELEDGPTKRLREIYDEGWDLFLRVFGDKSIVVTAVAASISSHPSL